MELKIRDDVSKQDKIWFAGLILFLIFWIWFVFYSGLLL